MKRSLLVLKEFSTLKLFYNLWACRGAGPTYWARPPQILRGLCPADWAGLPREAFPEASRPMTVWINWPQGSYCELVPCPQTALSPEKWTVMPPHRLMIQGIPLRVQAKSGSANLLTSVRVFLVSSYLACRLV